MKHKGRYALCGRLNNLNSNLMKQRREVVEVMTKRKVFLDVGKWVQAQKPAKSVGLINQTYTKSHKH